MIRDIISRFARTVTERRASPRKKFQLPIKIWFDPDPSIHRSAAGDGELNITGVTADISATGIGILVPSIRIKENYLVAEDRILNAEINLRGRKVRMRVIGRRYERVGIHASTEQYLVGAEIVEMSDDDRRTYEYFLKNGHKLKAMVEPSLEMGLE
ncbi:MAG TPA: PilZ domain-containing protein [Pyrinomonadaceae bacterium]|jgi:hypothetical protein|nr:PilZ domain-containing protein [Pyrinomonadaceae bacterium]